MSAHRNIIILISAAFAFSGLAIESQPALAQQKDKTAKAEKSKLTIPSAIKLDLLIRSTLMALDHANKTGNYGVLQDLGSPAFQRFYTPASLAEKFKKLREAKVGFSPILFIRTKLSTKPTLQNGRFLRLTGYVPTQPKKIEFDLAYQNVGGSWQVVAMSVGVSAAQPKVSSNSSKPGAKAARKKQ